MRSFVVTENDLLQSPSSLLLCSSASVGHWAKKLEVRLDLDAKTMVFAVYKNGIKYSESETLEGALITYNGMYTTKD